VAEAVSGSGEKPGAGALVVVAGVGRSNVRVALGAGVDGADAAVT
jgi:hypothetical protein